MLLAHRPAGLLASYIETLCITRDTKRRSTRSGPARRRFKVIIELTEGPAS
jgi:hypothetical protein